ncbi:MAG: hypothetical protein CMO26_01075 [Thiotrichales bacterium]|nr:hypothetical protein [Thiotrichales bacterium]
MSKGFCKKPSKLGLEDPSRIGCSFRQAKLSTPYGQDVVDLLWKLAGRVGSNVVNLTQHRLPAYHSRVEISL